MTSRYLSYEWGSDIGVSNFQPCIKHQVFLFFNALYNHTSPEIKKTNTLVLSETPSFSKTVTADTHIWYTY